MSIYKIKIRFSNFLMIFGHSQASMGRPILKHDVLDPSNEVLKPKKSNYPVGPTWNSYNSLNISQN